MKFCSEANSENTDSKAALLANSLASSSKQAAQAKAKGLRSLLCAIIPAFRRVFLHPRPNGRPNRLKARFSATVRVSSLPFPPELSAVRITDRVSGTRARIPLPSGSTPCAGFRAKSHKVSCKMPFKLLLGVTKYYKISTSSQPGIAVLEMVLVFVPPKILLNSLRYTSAILLFELPVASLDG